jgi:hypothetical protein
MQASLSAQRGFPPDRLNHSHDMIDGGIIELWFERPKISNKALRLSCRDSASLLTHQQRVQYLNRPERRCHRDLAALKTIENLYRNLRKSRVTLPVPANPEKNTNAAAAAPSRRSTPLQRWGRPHEGAENTVMVRAGTSDICFCFRRSLRLPIR